MNTYKTSIWTYLLSTINWQVKNKVWENKEWGLFEENVYRIPDGHKMILVTSMASVCEGAFKSFLVDYILENNFCPTQGTQNRLIKDIESSSWGGLEDKFDSIFSPLTFEDELENWDVGLFKSIKILFKSRNFLAHANNIKFSSDLDLQNFAIKGNAKPIYDYLVNNDLTFTNLKDKYLIEVFMTEEAITHYQNVMINFLKFLKAYRSVPSFIQLLTQSFYINEKL